MPVNEFTVANFDAPLGGEFFGQSFTPSDQGPDGAGSPGVGPTTVRLNSVKIGYLLYGDTGRANTCYIYSVPLQNQADIGKGANLVGESIVTQDRVGNEAFGPRTYSRQYFFRQGVPVTLDYNSTYYIYFAINQILRMNPGSVYADGAAIDFDMDLDPDLTLQIEIGLESDGDIQ